MLKRYYEEVICHWCNKTFPQRKDVRERQLKKYGHYCCRECYVKEPQFRSRRKEVMTLNNPFKNKKHTIETRQLLSSQKRGKPSWNKGLDISHPSIKRNIEKMKATKSKMDFTGANNPNWKGGRKPFENVWLELRKIIINRDFGNCWNCGFQFNSKNIEVHHLISKSKYPDYKYNLANCITLCKKCHKEFHRKYGTIKFTYNDFINWINSTRKANEKLVMC